MNAEERIKLFRLSHELLETDLDKVESQYKIDLGRKQETEAGKDEEYYPQFDETIRNEAEQMGQYYELLYCLENSIRKMIADKMEAEHGNDWWNQKVPQDVQDTAKKNIQKEREAGVTQRSVEEIDYINFGELQQIVVNNWQTFSDTFNNQKAFIKVMTILNTLRAPIAHCSPLAPDEVVRLKLSIKDWFRLME
ncbi:MAG: hypothetical protein A2471_03575 [Omnitrophica WOR_2 bacterium RIFOXYC2_FULL_45_15]|nr:MAG: hypothetical protein A2471_03575 [Omnitrophica WOR_2 bacterium RIFOXYC2_FULL_45_15]